MPVWHRLYVTQHAERTRQVAFETSQVFWDCHWKWLREQTRSSSHLLWCLRSGINCCSEGDGEDSYSPCPSGLKSEEVSTQKPSFALYSFASWDSSGSTQSQNLVEHSQIRVFMLFMIKYLCLFWSTGVMAHCNWLLLITFNNSPHSVA